jgi:O-antigen/teichoic acid export membrane protein
MARSPAYQIDKAIPAASGAVMPSLKHLLMSGSTWAFGGRVITTSVGLAVNVVLARLLSPRDLGAYFLAFSVASFGALLGSLGLNWAAAHFVAESIGLYQFERARRVVRILFATGTLGASGVAVLCAALGHTVVEDLYHSPALAAVTGLVAVWMLALVMQTLLAETFRGFHSVRLATLFNRLTTWVRLLSCLVLLCNEQRHSPEGWLLLQGRKQPCGLVRSGAVPVATDASCWTKITGSADIHRGYRF